MQRNGNKRHSQVFDYTAPSVLPGPGLVRRTSKKLSNADRQGHVYGKDELVVQGSLGRPVTPDDASSVATTTLDKESSSFGSPQSISSMNQHPTLTSAPRSQALRYESTRDRYVADSDSKTRPRTRTLDERARKTSFENKVRNRMGSMHTPHTTNAPAQPSDSLSSIGFPSIVSISPAVAQQRRARMHSPSRPLSPANEGAVPLMPAGLPALGTDTVRIMQLMKTTAGRMHGILFFRTSKSGPWSSGYCAINVASGSLIYQMKGDVSHAKTLIPDLRGCTVRTQLDPETNASFLEIASRTSDLGVHLRPHVPETFDSWLAALLCWQPLSPKIVAGVKTAAAANTKPTIRQIITNPRRSSTINLLRDASIIKVGKMLYWDRDVRPSEPAYGARRISTYKQQRSASGTPWRKISSTLQENGLLKLYRESDTTLIHQIPLSALNRFAIQRLHPTVLEDEYCLAIYPQYRASSTSALDLTHPIFLSLENRILFEVWFVLLRAFTTPELYGPEQPSTRASVDLSVTDPKRGASTFDQLFRVERVLSLRIVEAKIYGTPQDSKETNGKSSARSRGLATADLAVGDYHAEALIDGETRGRTAIKGNTGNPFWREDYDFYDLPPVIHSAAIVIKSRSTDQKDWYSVANGQAEEMEQDLDRLGMVNDVRVAPLDTNVGTVNLQLDDFDRGRDYEQWWSFTNEKDEIVGEILMKLRIDEAVVLMAKHYEALSAMLHQFSGGLTQQISFAILTENRKLHETLLNVFQFSGHASSWIMSLVEDEIDGIHKELPAPRYRYSRRIASNDSYDSGVERELILRDAGKNATQEANLLFRGNSLLTKALDFHMRRVGKEYLEETIGERMRDIDESDPDCEVDPNRIKARDDIQRNWRNLIALTESVWIAIKTSPSRCPPELRAIFRHVRACADDRYGAFLRNIKYSSVSGFLFLRFFCPAILNPKLFGLLKDHPRPRALRTLTFIAKSLQCLANLSAFGSKEPWMEPMNQFINTHRQEFKDYIDQICTVSTDQSTSRIPPSYATPLTIFSRLPQSAKEGFPSLPYLIDQPRELSSLTNVWIEATGDNRPTPQDGDEIVQFDILCHEIREKTKATIDRAMRADQTNGTKDPNLEGVAENYDKQVRRSTFLDSDSNPSKEASKPTSPTSGTNPLAALGKAARRLRIRSSQNNSTENSSRVSLQSNQEGPVSPIESRPGTGGQSSPWAESPATSGPPSAAEWDPSETEGGENYPSHTISWDKAKSRTIPTPLEEVDSPQEASADGPTKNRSAGQEPERVDTITTTTTATSGGSIKVPFSMSTSSYDDRGPAGSRESSKKFSDVWNFGRKIKEKTKDRQNGSEEQFQRSDDPKTSQRGTMTRRDRERGKKDRENEIRAMSEAARLGNRDLDLKGKGKSKK